MKSNALWRVGGKKGWTSIFCHNRTQLSVKATLIPGSSIIRLLFSFTLCVCYYNQERKHYLTEKKKKKRKKRGKKKRKKKDNFGLLFCIFLFYFYCITFCHLCCICKLFIATSEVEFFVIVSLNWEMKLKCNHVPPSVELLIYVTISSRLITKE